MLRDEESNGDDKPMTAPADAASVAGAGVGEGSTPADPSDRATPMLSSERHDRETRGVDDEIERAVEVGDRRRALSLCVQEHGHAMGRLCMAMVGSQAEADDLTQETFITAFNTLDAWRREGSLRAWLFGIARKKCLRSVEKQRRRDGRLRLIEGGDQNDTEDLVTLRQRAEIARAALDDVRPTEREALLLRYVAQLSFADVAVACGIEEATARKRVSRAIHRLRAHLESTE